MIPPITPIHLGVKQRARGCGIHARKWRPLRPWALQGDVAMPKLGCAAKLCRETKVLAERNSPPIQVEPQQSRRKHKRRPMHRFKREPLKQTGNVLELLHQRRWWCRKGQMGAHRTMERLGPRCQLRYNPDSGLTVTAVSAVATSHPRDQHLSLDRYQRDSGPRPSTLTSSSGQSRPKAASWPRHTDNRGAAFSIKHRNRRGSCRRVELSLVQTSDSRDQWR